MASHIILLIHAATIINHIFDLITLINSFLENHISTEALIAIPAISAALILPLSIFLIEDNNDYPIDKNVIFRNIFGFKELMASIIIDSIALVIDIKILAITTSLAVLFYTIRSLYRTYNWICEYDKNHSKVSLRQEYRIKYLCSLKEPERIFENWSQILYNDKLTNINQTGLITQFLKTYATLRETEDELVSSGFMRMLIRNLDKINLDDNVVYSELLHAALKFYSEKQHNQEKPSCLPYELHDLFMEIQNLSLKNQNYPSINEYRFFNTIEKFLDKNSDIDKNEFINDFTHDFLVGLEKNDTNLYTVWFNNFIKDISVTRNSIESQETAEKSMATFKALYDFTQRLIIEDIENDSRKALVLQKATEHILTKCDPIFWFDIITFTRTRGFVPIAKKNVYYSMIVDWCKTERSFGLMGRVSSFSFNSLEEKKTKKNREGILEQKIQKTEKEEQEETCYLIGIIQKWLLNTAEQAKLLKAINEIRNDNVFKKDSIEDFRLQKLELRIKTLRKYAKKRKK